MSKEGVNIDAIRDNTTASEYGQIEGQLKQMFQTQLSMEARQEHAFLH